MKEPESVTPPAARARLLWARLRTEYEGFPKRDPIAEIEAALLSQHAATVEACCRAICDMCNANYPLIDGTFHEPDNGSVFRLSCHASAIRALSPSAPGEERVLREIVIVERLADYDKYHTYKVYGLRIGDVEVTRGSKEWCDQQAGRLRETLDAALARRGTK